jgi:hypothetical protein
MQVIAEGAVQGAEAAKAAVILAAIGIVVFWRVILRLVLALIAIAVLVAVGLGVVALMAARP